MHSSLARNAALVTLTMCSALQMARPNRPKEAAGRGACAEGRGMRDGRADHGGCGGGGGCAIPGAPSGAALPPWAITPRLFYCRAITGPRDRRRRRSNCRSSPRMAAPRESQQHSTLLCSGCSPAPPRTWRASGGQHVHRRRLLRQRRLGQPLRQQAHAGLVLRAVVGLSHGAGGGLVWVGPLGRSTGQLVLVTGGRHGGGLWGTADGCSRL